MRILFITPIIFENMLNSWMNYANKLPELNLNVKFFLFIQTDGTIILTILGLLKDIRLTAFYVHYLTRKFQIKDRVPFRGERKIYLSLIHIQLC